MVEETAMEADDNIQSLTEADQLWRQRLAHSNRPEIKEMRSSAKYGMKIVDRTDIQKGESCALENQPPNIALGVW